MNYCTNCGKELAENTKFCQNCGAPNGSIPAPATTTPSDAAEEQDFLNETHRFLRYERTAWKVGAIVWFCLTGFIVGFLLLFTVLFGSIPELAYEEDLLFSGIFLIYAIFYGILLLPVAIINQIMVKRVNLYLDPLYTDVRPAAKRCGEVGMIVFSAFFNTIAMIFIIINFARIKSHRRVLDRILQKQQAAQSVPAQSQE